MCHIVEVNVWDVITIKTVPTGIQPPKLTEIKSIYVAFQTGAHFQSLKQTEIFSLIQS